MDSEMEFDIGPLTWVKGEIDNAFGHALKALEGWNGEDHAPLQAAAAHLHQVFGALQMVDLQGVSLVCAEAERLLTEMQRNAELRSPKSAAAATAAIKALQAYLDALLNGAPNTEMALMSVYTALLAERGAAAPPPSELFYPDTTVRAPRRTPEQTLDDAARIKALRGVRMKFQKGLLQLLQNKDPSAGLTQMIEALGEIEPLAPGPAQYTFWWSSGALIESVKAGSIPADFWVKRLCARIDLQMRRLMDGSRQLADRLIRDVFYYLAQDNRPEGRASEARERFNLEHYLPVQATAAGPSVPRAVLAALRETVNAAKEHWMKACAGRQENLDAFRASLSQAMETARSLPGEDLPTFLALIQEVATALPPATAISQNEGLQLEMATALLLAHHAGERDWPLSAEFAQQASLQGQRLKASVNPENDLTALESAPMLDEMSRKAQERLLMTQVVHEILANLHQAEEILDAFFRDHTVRANLPMVPGLLKQILGAFNILQLDTPGEVVKACIERIGAVSQHTGSVAPDDLNWIADAISTLGLYAEALRLGRDDQTALRQLLAPPAAETTAEDRLETAVREQAARMRAAVEDWITSAGDDARKAELKQALAQLIRDADLVSDPNLRAEAEALTAQLDQEAAARTAQAEKVAAEKAAAAAAVAAASMADASQQEIDQELLEIYLEEAKEVLANVDGYLARLHADLADHDAFVSTRRGFHTLKGSGRMVGLTDPAEVAWEVEQTLNVWLRDEKPVSAEMMAFIETATRAFAGWVADLEASGQVRVEAEGIVTQARRLRGELPPEAPPAPKAEPEAPEADTASDAEIVHVGEHALPAQLFQIFCDEARQRLAQLREQLEQLSSSEPPWHDFMRSAHTLAGISRTTGFQPLADAARSLERWIETLAQPRVSIDSAGQGALGEVLDRFDAMFGDIEFHTFPQPFEELQDRLAQIAFPATAPVLAPEDEYLPEVELPEVEQPEVELSEVEPPEVALAEVEQFEVAALPEASAEPAEEEGEGGELSEVTAAVEYAEAPAELDVVAEEAEPLLAEPELIELDIERPSEVGLIEEVLEETPPEVVVAEVPEPEVSAEPEVPVEAELLAEAIPEISPEPEATLALEASVEACVEVVEPAAEQAGAPVIETAPVEPVAAAAVPAEDTTHYPAPDMSPEANLDALLLPIFLAEAEELLPRIGESLQQWRAAPADLTQSHALQRVMHTLKGSARMAGAMKLGDFTHDLETLIVERGNNASTPGFLDHMEHAYDQIAEMLERLKAPEAPETPKSPAAPEPLAATASAAEPASLAAHAPAAADAPEAEPEAEPAEARTTPVEPVVRPAPAASARQSLSAKADVLDTLLNEAGEISIARARLENVIGHYKLTAQELTANVERLRNQLREMEIQAESQMHSQFSQLGDGRFDPLEFDRFTRLQELTRLMAESVNDVSTAQDNLLAGMGEAEAALTQQKRMARSLQQALMSIRMVPFNSQAEKLRRIVRQTARELGKKAQLRLEGGQHEIDRSVLEKIMAPLEHLLRNAVAHGIELPQQRQGAGKPEDGTVNLRARHEGNELVLSLEDDGAGINHEAVRRRAEAMGWVQPGETVSRERLEGFLFASGFSTAETVSKVAGRGVGMDVVRSEISAVGGRIRLDSEPGKGTRFTIRLPLTLALAPVVLVVAGEETFALPASTVVLVKEVKADEWQQIAAAGQVEFEGKVYPLRSLSDLTAQHALAVEGKYRTIMLLGSGEERVALRVDRLAGNYEAVVKNIGPQLARIAGISGATVLGDGRVALILNPFALAEQAPARSTESAQQEIRSEADQEEQAPLVLVVDDSLTVRKITGRLLTREGYRVATAKDGMEALEFLQDEMPAVMLLDIEMPRMDGFETARHVRADRRTHGLPIIMITSRTADKHRQHALELGVNTYMGKPYQEEELLAEIAGFVGKTMNPA